jgi:hypothetical protein
MINSHAVLRFLVPIAVFFFLVYVPLEPQSDRAELKTISKTGTSNYDSYVWYQLLFFLVP